MMLSFLHRGDQSPRWRTITFLQKSTDQNTESIKKDAFAIFIIFFKKHLHYIFFANHFFNYTPVC